MGHRGCIKSVKGYRKYNEPHFLKAAIEFSDFTVNLHFQIITLPRMKEF